MDWRLLVIEHIANIVIPLAIFFAFIDFFSFIFFFSSLQTSLLCIFDELAREGVWLWLMVLVTGDM